MTRTEEKILLSNLGDSDRKAFSVLYNLYAGKCLCYVRSILKDDEAAEDITHDVFVKVWLKRDIVSKVDNFSSYLFRMIRNAVMDSLESSVIRRRYVTESLMISSELCSYVDEKVSFDELQTLIFKTVGKMPEQRRRVFMLSRYKGQTNLKISEMLDLNIRTVENHISNALSDLKIALAKK